MPSDSIDLSSDKQFEKQNTAELPFTPTPSKIEELKIRSHKLLPTLPSLLSRPKIPLIHRDLSWLQYNERVLEQARPESQNSVMERTKFLAISSSNLDEFFMIRIASLKREILLAKDLPTEHERLVRIFDSILETNQRVGAKQSELFELLAADFIGHGIHLCTSLDDNSEAYDLGRQVFEKDILRLLKTTEDFSPHMLGLLTNLQMAVIFSDGLWIRIPTDISQVFTATSADGKNTYVFFLDWLLTTFLGQTFRSQQTPSMVRLTRDADVTSDLIDAGTEPTPDVIRNCLKGRDYGRPLRLQYLGNLTEDELLRFSESLNLLPQQVFPASTTLCLSSLWRVLDLDLHFSKAIPPLDLTFPASTTPKLFSKREVLFDKLKEKDILLHHPYDSFDAFIAWLELACEDPDVISIELTAYRLGMLSPIVEALKTAAQTKKVRLLIELRARFEENTNLLLAEELSKAGVEVAYGVGKLKLHAKIALVTRKEGEVLRTYTHLSTGNYNAKTARMYTDLAVLTAHPEMGEDARIFFDAIWQGKIPSGSKHLVLAPTKLHRRLIHLIEAEIKAAITGKTARIFVKVNALVDELVIAHLYRASQHGVKIDLMVRGACSLIPKVTGLSSNIRVISLIDGFLEHSRIYYFENSQTLYLSSADWMPRNFFRRLEIAFPVLDPRIFKYIEQFIIPTYLNDTVKARELTSQGIWKKRVAGRGKTPVRAQLIFSDLAIKHYEGTSLHA